MSLRVFAYVYTGWHPTPERDAAYYEGFTEWELVRACRPRFAGHAQPRVPLLSAYDDRDAAAFGERLALAHAHGVDGFVFGVFWCRGKRVFEQGLDQGFVHGPLGAQLPFACMWANRMPRRVLPVRRADLPVIEDNRRVASDEDDFVSFVAMLASSYFARDNYITVDGKSYLSIYDSSFFVRELGPAVAQRAIASARTWLRANGHKDLHLAAIEPNAATLPLLKELGFDSVTHYVHLPDWRGPSLQDYSERALHCAGEWQHFADASGLPYMPSVTPGWDASPRGADFGEARPDKYPWSPVIVGDAPRHFELAMRRACSHARATRREDAIVFVPPLNEWSEGHYLEPDERFGYGMLEALRAAR